jgi:glycosyltransferase involved in cell wall biosynthesis
VNDGETGLLFEPANAGDLADRLNAVAGDGRLRERLAAAGARAICDGYTNERSAERFAALYQEMLDRGVMPR